MKALLFSSLLVLGLVCGLPSYASAQQVDEFGYYGAQLDEDTYASPQRFALELRIGAYRPEIDSEFSGQHPYATTFGDNHRVMAGLEFDWQAIQFSRIANIGVGAGFGYTRMTAGMLMADGSGQRASQKTSLTIMPMWVAAVARFDALARQTVVPLVFYGKFGPATSLWWVRDGNGTARDANNQIGKGRSDGLIYAAGIMLSLDSLDKGAARKLDTGTGVNHSYIFGEWTVLNLGTSSQMLVGDRTWNVGLALEF